MKNITASVDEETHRRARTKAAERNTSVSALVKEFLIELLSQEPDARRLERKERELRARIGAFKAQREIVRPRTEAQLDVPINRAGENTNRQRVKNSDAMQRVSHRYGKMVCIAPNDLPNLCRCHVAHS
jgi:hypothetical protein